MKKSSRVNILVKSDTLNPALSKLSSSILKKLIKLEKAQFTELNILFCNDSFIKNLNFKYRGKNKPTDIITFYYDEGKRTGLIGDIMISLPTAKRQAKELGHTLGEELTILLVHGFYHLLGFDHIKDSDHKKMANKEKKALAKCNPSYSV